MLPHLLVLGPEKQGAGRSCPGHVRIKCREQDADQVVILQAGGGGVVEKPDRGVYRPAFLGGFPLTLAPAYRRRLLNEDWIKRRRFRVEPPLRVRGELVEAQHGLGVVGRVLAVAKVEHVDGQGHDPVGPGAVVCRPVEGAVEAQRREGGQHGPLRDQRDEELLAQGYQEGGAAEAVEGERVEQAARVREERGMGGWVVRPRCGDEEVAA